MIIRNGKCEKQLNTMSKMFKQREYSKNSKARQNGCH